MAKYSMFGAVRWIIVLYWYLRDVVLISIPRMRYCLICIYIYQTLYATMQLHPSAIHAPISYATFDCRIHLRG